MKHYLAIFAVIAGCSSSHDDHTPAKPEGSAATSVTVSDRAVRVPLDPPAVARVSYACSHSMQPFGNGSWSRTITYDLDAATVLSIEDNVPSMSEPRPPGLPGEPPVDAAIPANAPTHTEDTSALAPAKLSVLRRAVTKVMQGGPYDPEYPPSEGVSCQVVFTAKDGTTILTISKAQRDRKDAVNELLNGL